MLLYHLYNNINRCLNKFVSAFTINLKLSFLTQIDESFDLNFQLDMGESHQNDIHPLDPNVGHQNDFHPLDPNVSYQNSKLPAHF